VKGAPHAENGKAFIDWLLSKPVQEQLVSEIGRRSVRNDVTGAGLKPMSEIKLVEYDIKKVAQNRNDWVAKWKTALQNR
jgi:iron(III) transport system substrate-binding protein